MFSFILFHFSIIIFVDGAVAAVAPSNLTKNVDKQVSVASSLATATAATAAHLM